MALEEATEKGIIAEADVTQERLEAFLSRSGRSFYKLPGGEASKKIVLERKGETITKSVRSEDGQTEVGNSRAGAEVFSLRWA
jgi:dihydroorotase